MSSEDWVSESEALSDWCEEYEEDDDSDNVSSMSLTRFAAHIQTESDRSRMVRLYKEAGKARVGSNIKCPSCQKLHMKTTYHKVFCSNGKTKGKGKKNCKDKYWNFADRERCERAGSFK